MLIKFDHLYLLYLPDQFSSLSSANVKNFGLCIDKWWPLAKAVYIPTAPKTFSRSTLNAHARTQPHNKNTHKQKSLCCVIIHRNYDSWFMNDARAKVESWRFVWIIGRFMCVLFVELRFSWFSVFIFNGFCCTFFFCSVWLFYWIMAVYAIQCVCCVYAFHFVCHFYRN